LAVSLEGNTGPIQYHQQCFSKSLLGPFKVIGSVSDEKPLGQFNTIASFSQSQCWAHSTPPSASLEINPSPIQDHWQIVSKSMMGPFKAISSFS
jgi:hypothetical protein